MLFLVAAFLLLGVLVGPAAHLPPAATAAAGAVIAAWLLIFTVREYTRRHRQRS
ncbi:MULTISPECIES: hypothetical protein [Streptomyces]|uniref:Small hydrophobic membrane protein n=1 Tax=Streptomyces cacaoi TaxID=1898 RepID=A0A4Y3R0W3_STRCI|nr:MULTISPECIES: hypothetical protein [Streptomyces]NNG86308.1 hypothetical protein [Streptomyces cacaoi]GEB51142.1 hypothetical protein SCA03_36930 [Streptomyces cacaoi]